MIKSFRNAVLATTLLVSSTSLVPVNVLAKSETIDKVEYNSSEVVFDNYSKDKIYNNEFTLKPVSKLGGIVVIDSVIVNNKPQSSNVIDKSGENIVEVISHDIITNKKYKNLLIVNINKTPVSKYDTSLTSVRLGETTSVETLRYFKDEENDEIIVEPYEDEYIKYEQKGNSIHFTGKKEIPEHFITLKSSDYNGKGDVIENVGINVFTTKPDLEFVEVTYDTKETPINELLGIEREHILLPKPSKLDFKYTASDSDGGKARYELFDNSKVIVKGEIPSISKELNGTEINVSVEMDKLIKDNLTHTFKMVIYDDTNKTDTVIDIPTITILDTEEDVEELHNLITLYKVDLEENELRLTDYEVDKIYNINKKIKDMAKGKGFINSFTLYLIEALEEGTVKDLFINDFFNNFNKWAELTKDSIYEEDMNLLNLHYINHIHNFDVNITLDKLREEIGQVKIDDIKNIILIERDLNLLEDGYDIVLLTNTILNINKLPESEVKTNYLEHIKILQSDYTLGNNLYLTASDFKYFSEVYNLENNSFKKDEYLDDYIYALTDLINRNNKSEEKLPLYSVLVNSIEQTSEIVRLIEFTKGEQEELSSEQVKDVKEYIKNNNLVDIFEYRKLKKDFEGGKKITPDMLKSVKNVYYNENYHNLYVDQVNKLDKNLTYKEYLNFINLLNVYQEGMSNKDMKIDSSIELMKYFNYNNKYRLINNLNKDSLEKFNKDRKYRESKKFKDYGIIAEVKEYRKYYNNVINELIKNDIEIDVELLHNLVLYINDSVPLLENNVIYDTKILPKASIGEIFESKFNNYESKDKFKIKDTSIKVFEKMFDKDTELNKKRFEYKKVKSKNKICKINEEEDITDILYK